MSLINNMLKDLEQRRQPEQGADGPLRLKEVQAVSQGPRPVRGWLLGLALILGSVLGGAFLMVRDLPADKEQAQPEQAVQAVSPATTPVEVAATPQEDAAPAGADVNEPSRLLNLSLFTNPQRLRVVGEFDRAPEYVVVPGQGKNSLTLEIDGAEQTPKLSPVSLQDTFLQQLSVSTTATGLQLYLSATAPFTHEVLVLQPDSGFGYRLALDLYPEKTVAEKSIPAERQEPVSPSPEPEMVSAPQELQPKAEAAPGTRFRITEREPTQAERAEMLYQRGQKELGSGNLAAAEELFRGCLLLLPEHLAARQDLIGMLDDAGRTSESGILLDQGLKLRPGYTPYIKGRARQLLAGGDRKAALELLQQGPVPALKADVEYHALLAAIAQQQGEHQLAARLYHSLVQVQPGAGIWWLGLAISLDHLGKVEQAVPAYRRSLAAADLKQHLQSYAQERLKALGGSR